MLTYDNAFDQLRKLSNQKRELLKKIENNLVPGVQFTYCDDWGLQIKTDYFNEHNPDKLGGFFEPCLAEKLAYEIKDYDYPVPKSDGLMMSKFLGFTDKQTKMILGACTNDESYQQWTDEERARCY